MINYNRNKFTQSFNNLNVETLARETHFCMRKSSKIQVLDFLNSFFEMILCGKFSLRNWATILASLSNIKVSFQALSKKMHFRQLEFTQTLLSRAISQSFESNTKLSISNFLSQFSRVLVEDSSCIKLSRALYHAFPGNSTPNGPAAIAKVQLLMDLNSNTYQSIHLSNYCENDRTYSPIILNQIQPNDLIIRDLGYFKINVFKHIQQSGAFFLSRYCAAAALFNRHSGAHVDLVKLLKKFEKQQIKTMDTEMCLGFNEFLPVRIVAFKLKKEQSQVRLRHAIKCRHKNEKMTENAKYLLTWNIFITNIPDQVCTTEEIYQAYTFRWHIEMTFKNWKSYFKIDEFMGACKGPNPAKPEMIFNLCLIFLTLVFIPKFNYYFTRILFKFNKYLSPFKFADWIINLYTFHLNSAEDEILNILSKYSCYNVRSDRKNYFEKLFAFS